MANNNPFAVAMATETRPSAGIGGALANTDQQRAVAEVQAGMMLAKMSPRDQVSAMDRILNACQRPTLAESAIYTYSRGGNNISGPSIRLAEAMAQAWGNLSFGIRELEQAGGESTVQAYCWDMETNVRREMTFQVAHVRKTKTSTYKIEDPRDIYEHVANQGARRLRSCILAVIPGDVTEAAVNQCEETMKSKADTSPAAMQKMLEVFAQIGVTKEQIEKRIQRRIESIQPAQVVALRKIHNSLKDGMSIASDWFEQDEEKKDGKEKSKTESLKDELQKKKTSGSGGDSGQKNAKTPPPLNDHAGGNASASADAVRGKKESLLLKEFDEIDKLDSTDKLDTWLFKHCNRCTSSYGADVWEIISDYAKNHRGKITTANDTNDIGPETIICPESGGRMVKDDCAMSECSKMCPVFNVGGEE